MEGNNFFFFFFVLKNFHSFQYLFKKKTLVKAIKNNKNKKKLQKHNLKLNLQNVNKYAFK